jgi:hypothetical protein
MQDYQPQVVHFCGHGEGQKGLVLEDESGQAKLVSTEALANLFELFSDQVECVLLNACYSEVQAQDIAQHIEAVIGMNQPIGDRAAIEFAVGFYDALGAGESVEFAFRSGRTAMQLAGIAEEQTPVLIAKPESTQDAMLAASGDSGESRQLIPVEQAVPQSTGGMRSRIFISYKRGVEPDEPVAVALYQALRQTHAVFIDQTMTVGTRWAERIEAEIRQSDFLMTLLSAHTVQSEMVVGEVETAHRLFKQCGKPVILPIRLAYRDPFVYPLSAYLNEINWAFWDRPADTDCLLAELQRAIAGEALSIGTAERKADLLEVAPVSDALPHPLPVAQPVSLEMPEGTMAAESQFYVERSVDAIAVATVQQSGVTITIKGPRQMGKSSLLNRIVVAARQTNKRDVSLDLLS